MVDIEWREYSRVGPATPEQIARVEVRVGHKFPEDFKQALLKHQGMAPRPSRLQLDPGWPKKGFGVLRNCVEGHTDNIAEFLDIWREDGYPTYLVPISTAKGQPHFALDYRAAEEDPAIVYVLPEYLPDPHWDDPGDSEWDFLVPAASSFTELLEKMEE